MKRKTQLSEFCLDPFLVSLPAINPNRRKLSERITVTGDKLANRAHKYLSLAPEYNARERYARDQAAPPANVYPIWTVYKRIAPVSKIPYLLNLKTNSTAEYVAAFDSLNGLRALDAKPAEVQIKHSAYRPSTRYIKVPAPTGRELMAGPVYCERIG